jgi:lysophospholipase L1-like esterase
MPLGDSISICCHYCDVSPNIITDKSLAEPALPWEGYIRKFWWKLKRRAEASHDDKDTEQMPMALRHGGASSFSFEYVGRVVSCAANRTREGAKRVPADFDVRYEGYYGYPTRRILNEVVQPALAANDPDMVLLLLGTNDIIQLKAGLPPGYSRISFAVDSLRRIIDTLLTTPRRKLDDAGNALQAGTSERERGRLEWERSRVVIVGKIPPVWFRQIRRFPPQLNKPRRVAKYNAEMEKLVEELQLAQRRRFDQFHLALAETLARAEKDGTIAKWSDAQVKWFRQQQRHPPPFVPSVTIVNAGGDIDVHTDLHGDGIHPNHSGEEKIAAAFFQGAEAVLRNITQTRAYERRAPILAAWQNSDVGLRDALELLQALRPGDGDDVVPSRARVNGPFMVEEDELPLGWWSLPGRLFLAVSALFGMIVATCWLTRRNVRLRICLRRLAAVGRR